MYSVQDQISDLSNMYPHNKFEITDGFPFWKYHLKAILQCFRNMSILKNDIYKIFIFISLKVVGGDLNAEGSEAKPVIDFATVPGYDDVRLDKCGYSRIFFIYI